MAPVLTIFLYIVSSTVCVKVCFSESSLLDRDHAVSLHSRDHAVSLHSRDLRWGKEGEIADPVHEKQHVSSSLDALVRSTRRLLFLWMQDFILTLALMSVFAVYTNDTGDKLKAD